MSSLYPPSIVERHRLEYVGRNAQAAIRVLSPEILEAIFALVVGKYALFDMSSGPWMLCHVCHFWKFLCYGISKLWANMDIQLPPTFKMGPGWNNIIRNALLNSRKQPLSFNISCPQRYPDPAEERKRWVLKEVEEDNTQDKVPLLRRILFKETPCKENVVEPMEEWKRWVRKEADDDNTQDIPLLRVLFSEAHRWKNVEITASENIAFRLLMLDNQAEFPLLERFALTLPSLKSLSMPLAQIDISRAVAPKLQKAELQSVGFDDIRVHESTLRKFSETPPFDQLEACVRTTLTTHHRLRSYAIEEQDDRLWKSKQPAVADILHKRLRVLEFLAMQPHVLSSFVLPALEDLTIGLPWSPLVPVCLRASLFTKQMFDAIIRLVRRSKCTVQVFTVRILLVKGGLFSIKKPPPLPVSSPEWQEGVEEMVKTVELMLSPALKAMALSVESKKYTRKDLQLEITFGTRR